MKKMSQHRHVIVLAISLLTALNMGVSLAVNPLSATKGTVLPWSGTQVPGAMTLHKIRIVGNCMKIHGKIRMNVIPGGYVFDGVDVAYEVIRYLEIYQVPPEVLESIRQLLSQDFDLDDPANQQVIAQIFGVLYSCPRSGWFTWHAGNGEVVGRGTFETEIGTEGSLLVRGRVSVLVEGTFCVNGFTVSHDGTYIVR